MCNSLRNYNMNAFVIQVTLSFHSNQLIILLNYSIQDIFHSVCTITILSFELERKNNSV